MKMKIISKLCFGEYKRCACGELLLAAEEVSYGVCLNCVNDIMEGE